MRWSVGIEAEAGAVLTREQVVELADAVAASGGVASGIGTSRYGARLIVQADSREEAVARATEEFTAAAAKAGLPPGPVVRTEAVSEDEDPMIRLGSLAGYPFEGPRVLAGWTPPPSAAVYVIAYKPDPDTKPDRYAVIYVGHSDDLTRERFPFQHPRAHCWIKRAGSKWKVYICTYEVPGGGRAHREQIARELTAIYRPRCNDQQYDQAWKDQWIGETTSSSPRPGQGPGASRSVSRECAVLGDQDDHLAADAAPGQEVITAAEFGQRNRGGDPDGEASRRRPVRRAARAPLPSGWTWTA